MKRRDVVLTGLALVAAGVPARAMAQASRKPAQIGWLNSGSRASFAPLLDAFLAGLRELGYAETRDFVMTYRWADGQEDRLPAYAREFVAAGVDVIVAGTIPAVIAARDATATIPIVMAGAGDPVGQGVAASLARPRGNVTGTSNQDQDLMAKRLEILVTLVPRAGRIAVLRNPDHPLHPQFLAALASAAPALGVTLVPIDVHGPPGLDAALAEVQRAAPGALLVLPDGMFGALRGPILEFAATARLPAMFSTRPYVDAGALISYGTDLLESYRRAAGFVDRILKGARPADLPVEQPTKFELAINLKTAKAIGLTVPPSLLARADVVIE